MPSLTKSGSEYIFIGGYDDRSLPKAAGFRWNPAGKRWWTDDPKKAGRLVGHVDMADAVREALEAATAVATATVVLSRAADSDLAAPAPEGLEYYPFQRAGIQFASTRPSTLFGDEMGVGKTIEAIGTVNADASMQSVLVICPASIRLNWQRELRRWLVRDMTVGVAVGSKLPDTDIVVINYDILGRHVDALKARAFDVAIVDEIHYIKNPKTARYKAVADILQSIPRRLALTGTPIPNRPIEGWAVFNLLAPEMFPNFWGYAKRYCAAYRGRFGWDMSGSSNLEELQIKLRESIMIRRLKKDVLTELPPKVRQVITLPENGLGGTMARERQRAAEWEEALAEARAALDEAGDDPDAYEAAVRALEDAQRVAFTEMSAVRHETALAKAPYVAKHVEELLGEVDKVVVFAHHHDVVDSLMEALAEYNPVRLTGQDSNAAKDEAVQAFQTDPTVRVFVGSILAAGVGLTLTAASMVVFAEMDWVPGNMSQAEDRLHRIGQRDSVLVQHVVVDGSLDARMAQVLVEKQAVLDAALDDPTSIVDETSFMDAITTAKEASSQATAKRAATDKAAADMPTKEFGVIQVMLTTLADLCDGAQSRDGMGFNATDTMFGRSLAAANGLTLRQAVAAKRMLHKYRGQLSQELGAEIVEEVFGD